MPTLGSLFSNEPSSPSASKPTMPTLKSLFANDPLPSNDPSPPKATKPTIYLNFFKSIFTSGNQSPPPNSLTAITDFIKIITTNSKSAFQIFSRDMMKEFRSDLKKEVVVIRDIASRSIRELDGFGSSVRSATAEIIAHGRDAVFSPDSDREGSRVLETQPDDFGEWKLGFRIEEKREEIESFRRWNSIVEDFYRAFVPDVLDHETFWTRYFYRIHKDRGAALEDRREVEDLMQEVDVEAKDEILEIGQVLKTESGGDDVNLMVEDRAGSDCSESSINDHLELNEESDEKLGLSERSDEKLVAGGKKEEVDGLREKKKSDEDDDELGWVEIENFGDESSSCDSLNRPDDDLSWEIEDYEPDME